MRKFIEYKLANYHTANINCCGNLYFSFDLCSVLQFKTLKLIGIIPD